MPKDKDLPQRSTRGRRMKQQLDDEEDEADNAFWNQEFFKEEAVDDDYKTESEPEDVIDSDFDESEGDDDDEEVVELKDEPKKKAMKPPGWKPKPKAPAKPKPKAKAPSDDEEEEEEEEEAGGDEEEGEGEGEEGGAAKGKAGRKRAASPPPEPMVYVAPTLRRSTVTRVADSQRDRKEKVKTTRKRTTSGANANWRPLTQSEMLAEAALNEIENTRSLKSLLAQEEETKRKAQVNKRKNAGPSVKFRSRRGVDGLEHTTFELVNTYILPPWMLKARAPPPPPKPLCPITGMAARHVDPASRTPYANALAFRRLRTGEGPLPPALQQQLAMDEQLERHARESSRSSARERASGELSRSLGLNRAVGRVQLQELQQQGATGGHGAAGGLGGQLAAQRQRAAQLEAHVAGLVEAARVDPGYNFNQLGATADVMAMVVDVHRTLTASA